MTNIERKDHDRLGSHTPRLGKFDLALYTAPPTQPALSDDDFVKIIRPFYGTDEACKMALPLSIDEFRALEAHCRGQAAKQGGANG